MQLGVHELWVPAQFQVCSPEMEVGLSDEILLLYLLLLHKLFQSGLIPLRAELVVDFALKVFNLIGAVFDVVKQVFLGIRLFTVLDYAQELGLFVDAGEAESFVEDLHGPVL